MPALPKRYSHVPLALGLLGLLAPVPGHAQAAPVAAPSQPAATATTPTAATPAVEPAALDAVGKMGAALRALPYFTVDADVTNETVLDTGQKLQFSGTLRITSKPPTGFLISVVSDAQNRDYYYNGSTLTVVAPKLRYYASAPAPGSIREVVNVASDRFGIDLPLADLFLWGTDPVYAQRLRSGYVVRPQTIEGRECMQYAFRQAGADWQVWIPTSGQPLPCKLVITDTRDSSMPQYSAVLKWNTNTAPAAQAFTFAPPAGFTRIKLSGADGQPAAGGVQ